MILKKEVTIYDLAEHLGVSAATVSRALNDHPSVSKKTRRIINDLAKEMGYQQNNFARNLRQKTSHTIGVIVHELNSHFITSVLSGIEKVIAEYKYNIIIGHSDEKSSREAANALNLFHKRVDGLIVSLAYDTESLDHYDLFAQRGIPVVFFDRVRKDSDGIKVTIDNEKAGYEATTHLIQQGCKKIMHVTGNLTQNVYADRLKGFQKALSQHELAFASEQLVVNDLSERTGIAVAEQILQMKDKPDGLFVTNDLCAAVCMQRLKEGGIKVPEDMAIVGFNDDIISRIVEPKLTTVRYNGREMGEIAARNLMDQLNNHAVVATGYNIVLRSELIIRQSSVRVKHQ
jgi:LacI family transcriptional regulator